MQRVLLEILECDWFSNCFLLSGKAQSRARFSLTGKLFLILLILAFNLSLLAPS